jgi:hypothetical protein
MNKITPYLDDDGTLVIPFECSDHAYKYWKQEGKPLGDILAELGVSEDIRLRYTQTPPGEAGADTPDEPADEAVAGPEAVADSAAEEEASLDGGDPVPPEARGEPLAVVPVDSPPAE